MASRSQIDKVINKHQDDIASLEASDLATYGKYKFYKRGVINDSVEVHEYVRPDGGVGYIIYVYAVEGGDTYVKTFEVGDEPIDTITSWTMLVGGII
jgi:hypothetical protein